MIAARVLIQGGGIGGLIAAAALAQRGADVDVVEHRPAASVLGVGLIQPPNALRVMAEIGVLDDCLAAGYQGDGMQVVGPDGTVLAQAPAPPPGDLPAAGNGIQRRDAVPDPAQCGGQGGSPAVPRCRPSPPSPTDGDGVTATFRGEYGARRRPVRPAGRLRRRPVRGPSAPVRREIRAAAHWLLGLAGLAATARGARADRVRLRGPGQGDADPAQRRRLLPGPGRAGGRSRSTGSPDRTSSRRCRACCRGSVAGSARCAT